MEYDAILEDPRLSPISKSKKVAVGYIYEDKKGRWPDGTFIRTSLIEKEIKVGNDVYIKTMNTVYKVRENA